jgi:hypothetical protein
MDFLHLCSDLGVNLFWRCPKMKTRLCLLALFLSFTATALAYGQGVKKPRTIDDYRPRTMQELSTSLPDTFRKALAAHDANKQKTAIVVHAEMFPSRVKVAYAETRRPLLEGKKNVISAWANQFAGMPEFYTAPYQTEILVTEDGENYWLAVKEEFLTRELKKGEMLELCVIKLGNARVADKLEPVLLVEQVVP